MKKEQMKKMAQEQMATTSFKLFDDIEKRWVIADFRKLLHGIYIYSLLSFVVLIAIMMKVLFG